MKRKFRIAVKTEVQVYLEVEATCAKEAYDKVRHVEPLVEVKDDHWMPHYSGYSNAGVIIKKVHVGNHPCSGRKSGLPLICPIQTITDPSSVDETYQFIQWVNHKESKYSSENFWVEEVLEIPPLTRVLNKWNKQEGGSETFNKLMKVIKSVIPSRVANDLREDAMLSYIPRGYHWETMHGVGGKTLKAIAEFNAKMKDSEEMDKLMALPDFPRT